MIIFMKLKKQKINHERIFCIAQREKKYFKPINIQNFEMLKNYYLFYIMGK